MFLQQKIYYCRRKIFVINRNILILGRGKMKGCISTIQVCKKRQTRTLSNTGSKSFCILQTNKNQYKIEINK